MATAALSQPTRVKYEPTPRNPSIPIGTELAVRIRFVQSCPDCRKIVAQFGAACANDASVTSYAAVPGTKHCHDVVDGERALPLEAGNPVSDTNGSAPELVDAAAGIELFPEVGTNGFDPNL